MEGDPPRWLSTWVGISRVEGVLNNSRSPYLLACPGEDVMIGCERLTKCFLHGRCDVMGNEIFD